MRHWRHCILGETGRRYFAQLACRLAKEQVVTRRRAELSCSSSDKIFVQERQKRLASEEVVQTWHHRKGDNSKTSSIHNAHCIAWCNIPLGLLHSRLADDLPLAALQVVTQKKELQKTNREAAVMSQASKGE
jgi:hypothetical protein